MTVRIKLYAIPSELHPDDEIPCTVDGFDHEAYFVRYGEDQYSTELRTKIWVRIVGLHESRSGVVQPDMFSTYTTEFTVNADRTAYTAVWG